MSRQTIAVGPATASVGDAVSSAWLTASVVGDWGSVGSLSTWSMSMLIPLVAVI
jgi:hypothetical protein